MSGTPDVTECGGRRQLVAMRRQVILNDLRRHPLSTARQVNERILAETGGAPALLTGALYIAPWTVYADLRALERAGKVGGWRDPQYTRTVGWQALDEPHSRDSGSREG